ncbi:hypothetical protein J2Z21_009117 [Streptomyces griseochromogenes]|uniref:Uncharacterized protein n=1 Tax=Streptomyces griseochromogenes TaxID=68214 RepID=A0A1B1AZ32_9ACTN|nr:hypothetical protein AVL59_21615 [Streptomyces griseochromogenes]MBP2056100.1 hypothetical protein [Streptomyces griseochromogenes]
MHYVAAHEEHAEQAFLAAAKLQADGTHIIFSRDDHDSLHLFNRADRFLLHGWCVLSPLQACDKGNVCLTCSVFVAAASHQSALQGQLAETEALINRSTRERIRMEASEQFAAGAANAEVAKDLRVSVRSVQRWRRAWQDVGA